MISSFASILTLNFLQRPVLLRIHSPSLLHAVRIVQRSGIDTLEHDRQVSLRGRTEINGPDAAIATHLLHLADDELFRTLGGCGFLVAEDEDVLVLGEITVEIF